MEKLKFFILILSLASLTIFTPFESHAGGVSPTPPGFYGSDNFGNIFLFDPYIPSVTFLGTTGTVFGSTEIECTSDGLFCVSQNSNGLFSSNQVRLNPPLIIGPTIFNGASFNGLEYVGSTLYGTSILFPCDSAILSTLDPLTGVSIPIGPTLTGRPMSGLAYDVTYSMMYGVDGCGSAGISFLYTVNLTTGLATPIGPTGVTLGSLEFGPDGKLYAGGDRLDGGKIYEIDPSTGQANFVISSGFGSVTGLTLVPLANSAPICEEDHPHPNEITSFGSGVVVTSNISTTITNIGMPPHHKTVEIFLSGISDVDGDELTINIDSITQDEPTSSNKGDKSPDGFGVGTDTALIRSEREGQGDGRVYEISFTVDDGNGGICSSSRLVGVPHDNKHNPIDSGQIYDSTLP